MRNPRETTGSQVKIQSLTKSLEHQTGKVIKLIYQKEGRKNRKT